MTKLFECIDGPYRGFIVAVADNQSRVEVRDIAGRMPPEWYEISGDRSMSLVWTSDSNRRAPSVTPRAMSQPA
jgi:hypothetical protein